VFVTVDELGSPYASPYPCHPRFDHIDNINGQLHDLERSRPITTSLPIVEPTSSSMRGCYDSDPFGDEALDSLSDEALMRALTQVKQASARRKASRGGGKWTSHQHPKHASPNAPTVVLAAATKQYNNTPWVDAGKALGEVRIPRTQPVTFNETPDVGVGDGPDHWYHCDPKSAEAEHYYNTEHELPDEHVQMLGSIFTTRMPRCVEYQEKVDDVWMWSKGGKKVPLTDKLLKDQRESVIEGDTKVYPGGVTDGRKLQDKIRENKIELVVFLVEDEELEKMHSSNLVAFYESCAGEGQTVTVLRTPFEDFTSPSSVLEHKDIVLIALSIAEGKNILVHCMGGSGRTGTIVVGALANLGIMTAKEAIAWSHTVKSTYIEIPPQLELVLAEGCEADADGQSIAELVKEVTARRDDGEDDVALKMISEIWAEEGVETN